MVKLVRSYADGRTDDEAFETAIGMDVAAFNDAWLADIGAALPQTYGPQPAPPGPRPSDWGAPPPPLSGATSEPQSGATSPPTTPRPDPTSADAQGVRQVLLLTLAALTALGIVLLVVIRARPRRPSEEPPWRP